MSERRIGGKPVLEIHRRSSAAVMPRLFGSFIALAFLAAISVSPVNADDGAVRDNFDRDEAGTLLSLHTLRNDSVGGGWVQSAGADFRIDVDGKSARDAGLNIPPRIAFIDTLLSEFELTVTINRSGTSSLTGVVFRYVDSTNFMAAVHDGRRLELFKIESGEKSVLKRRSFKSKAPSSDLWNVAVGSESIDITINGKRMLSVNDSIFATSTIAGLIQQASQATSFKDFSVSAEDDDGSTPPPVVPPSPPVVHDSFTAPDGTLLDAHTGTEVTSGGGWSEVTGGWEIAGGMARLATPDPVRPSGNHVAVIPSNGAPLQEISADLSWHGGFVGLAWNVSDSTRYSLVFWDGMYLVVGRVQGGAFLERGRQLASWSPGQTRNLRIRLHDGHAFVYLDDSEPILLAFGIEEPAILNAGLFDRFNAGNSFDNFIVRESPPGLDLPQSVPGPPLAPPTTGPTPIGGWLHDSFDAPHFSLLRHRAPEVDPSGQGWTDEDGFWMVLWNQATEQSGVFGPGGFDRFAVIDTGLDEYKLKSSIEWDGGRAGVFFGGRSSGPDDAGRNGFIFFRSGDTLHIGRLIAGFYFGIGSTREFKWNAGSSRTLEVIVEEDEAELKLNGDTIFEFSDGSLENSTWSGLFQRGGNEERFDDFTVQQPG